VLLILWSAPRSRSTAFFRMMAERGDFTMAHGPFSYLAELGHADVAGRRLASARGLIAALRSLAGGTQVFVKETTGMPYPEVIADQQFLASDAQHTFLIRHPRETISSYYALEPDAGLHKIGFESQYEIFAEVPRLTRQEPVVVDSGDLITHPAATIRAYCERIGIVFRPEALTWAPSDRPEWEPSRRWHADVAASGGFTALPTRPSIDIDSHPVLSRYLDYHLPFYEELRERRLAV